MQYAVCSKEYGVWRSCGGGIHRSTTTRAAAGNAHTVIYSDAHSDTELYTVYVQVQLHVQEQVQEQVQVQVH